VALDLFLTNIQVRHGLCDYCAGDRQMVVMLLDDTSPEYDPDVTSVCFRHLAEIAESLKEKSNAQG
jgi:hypothetical protein